MESSVLFHAQKSWTEIISSCLFMPSRLKKSTYKCRIKIVPSRFLSCPGSHINSPYITFLGENKKLCWHFSIITFITPEFATYGVFLHARFSKIYLMHNFLRYFKRTNLISTIIVIIFWYFTKSRYHHGLNEVRLLVINLVDRNFLMSCRTT